MNIKLKVNIDDIKMSDGLLSAMSIINQINRADENNITIDFSEVKFVTPLFVLPLFVFLNTCSKNVTVVNINDYLQTIGFTDEMYPDKMRKSEFMAKMEKYTRKTYIPIVSFPALKDNDDEKDSILSTVETIIVRQLGIAPNVATGLKYMLGESIDNIIQHANSERG